MAYDERSRQALLCATFPMREYIVVSVGGSLLVPNEIDTTFLVRFREVVLKKVQQGFSFYIITGGGKLARNYQHTAKSLQVDSTRDDLDWLGIHATRLNGHLLRTLFADKARPRLIKDPTRSTSDRYPIIIGAGWKPGWSTDYCAVLAAEQLDSKKLVNLSNIDYVYDKNPRTNVDAQKIEHIGWKEFRKLLPTKWDPGMSAPFDPIAAREAEAMGLEVVVMNGQHLEEFEKYLEGESFRGTTIQ